MEILIWVVILGFIGWGFIKLLAGPTDGGGVNTVAAQHGATLDFQYRNLLGIDTKGERVFVTYTVLAKNEIRLVEKSSILETRIGGFGNQFHKDKHCKLIIHTRSIEQPLLTVPFGNKSEMDEWYSRLGVFCNLS